MKLYLAHSSNYDYQTELYAPMKQFFADHEVFYPHDLHNDGIKSKDVIPTCDAVIAEVSFPSTGEGIEIGWADAANIPIICLYKKGASVSSALRFISDTFVEYDSHEEMIEKLKSHLMEV